MNRRAFGPAATAAIVVLSLIVLPGPARAADAPGATTAPAPANGPTAPTEQELLKFARALEASVARGDTAFVRNRFDADAFIAAATDGIAANPVMKKAFIDGLQGRAGGGKPIFTQFADQLARGRYRFLHLVRDDANDPASPRVPLFRLEAAEGGVNYHKLYVRSRAGDGQLVIVDLYVAVSGEPLTQTLRRSYIPIALQSLNPNAPETKALLDGYGKLVEINAARQNGEHVKALEMIAALPEKVRRDKMVQLVRLMTAAHVGDAEYERAMADVAPLLKGEVAPDLVEIDRATLAGKYDDALAAIERVDKWVGGQGDPYLDVMRANAHLAAGRVADAKRAARRAIERDPDSYAAHDFLLAVSLEEKDHAETARLLGVFEEKFGLEFGDLTDAPNFAAFVDTPEYKRWVARRKDAGAGAGAGK